MALMGVLLGINLTSCSKEDIQPDDNMDDKIERPNGIPSNIPTNTIYYITTNNTVLRFENSDVFGGAVIFSNTYSSEKGFGTLVFTSDVTAIDEKAFSANYKLAYIALPNSVKSIGDGAFQYCENLTSVTIPNSVKSIGDGAFQYCENLTSVTIPNSVKSIGFYAFEDCENLTSVTIGDGVKGIGVYAFDGCTSLTAVHISDIAAWCKIKFYDNPLSYAGRLYLNGEEVKDLVIPNSVESIGEDAFLGCTSLTSVTIGDGVKSIGESAFCGCENLTSVTIPKSVESIGECAFAATDGLKEIKVDKDNLVYDSRENCNAIIETASNTLIVGCRQTIIPNSVESIGDFAFSGCSGLTSVTIPNSVTSIGDYAFYECSGLTSVTIGNSVTSIGDYAFWGCSGLTSVTIPNSVTSIGDDAFSGCRGLTSVTIGNSVESIGSYAFLNCSGLTSVTIPNSVTSIGDYAFSYCDKLKKIYCHAKVVPETKSSVFDSTPIEDATLYVPAGSIYAYQSKNPWYDFGKFVAIEMTEVDPRLRYEALAGKWTMTTASGKKWNVTVHAAAEGEPDYNEVLYVTGMMGYDEVVLKMPYSYNSEEGKLEFFIEAGERIAQGLNFSSLGESDIYLYNLIDSYLTETDFTANVSIDDSSITIDFGNATFVGGIFQGWSYTGYNWFRETGVKMTRTFSDK